MILTGPLIFALKHTTEPAVIRGLSKMLTATTGISERQVLSDYAQKSDIVGSFDTITVSDWYQRNGYYGIAGLGGFGSYSGKSITPDSAIEVAAVYACVKILAEDMGSLPFFLYRKTADGSEQERIDPRFRMIHDLANPDTSAGELVEALTAHAALTGNGYARIERNSQGRPFWLFPIQPGNMRLEKGSGGTLRYFVRDSQFGNERAYERSEIFHLRGFTFDGLAGDEILKRARHAIGIASAAQEYAGRFFANDASTGIILKRPMGTKALGPDAVRDLKKGWLAWHQGVSKSHEPAILQEGMEAVRVDPDLEKLQMIQQRKFQVIEVARLWRMPLHKLGDLERAIQSNIEQQQIEYTSHTLSPWVRRWRQAFHRCLLTRDEQITGELYAEHSVEAMQRGDFRTQAEGFGRLLEKGVYSINDVRRMLNLNPIPGGDKHYIQLNMQAVSTAATAALVDQGSKLLEVAPEIASGKLNGKEVTPWRQ